MRTSWIRHAVSVGVLILLPSLVVSSRPPAPSPQAPQIDASKMADVYGLHLGMPAQEAKAVLEKQFAQFRAPVQSEPIGFGPGNRQQGIYSFSANAGGVGGQMAVDVTLPPNPQLVWHIVRSAPQPNVNRAVVLAALRQKYGKETYAVAFSGVPGKTTTDDSVTKTLVWLMDEQGRALTIPITFVLDRPFDCWVFGGVTTGTKPPEYQPNPNFCAKSIVGLSVSLNDGEIIRSTYTESVDFPLAQRSAQATEAYTKNGNQQLQQQIQQKSQEVKPNI